jgi:hypothetical protein
LAAQDILNELGEDFQFEDDTFDEAKVQKLGGVAKKWINGVLSSAFNSWVEACKLLHVHTISIFECYRRNAAGKLSECKRFDFCFWNFGPTIASHLAFILY